MIQRKICMLGSFSVGKTSLIRRFVSSMFDDTYLTTVGVKIDKKTVELDDRSLMLMIWDLAGEDDYNVLKTSYLRGAHGYLLVVDSTRPKTLEVAFDVHDKVRATVGDVPCIMALNKTDLVDEFALDPTALAEAEATFQILKTSAKTGNNVEALFSELAEKL